MEGREEVLGLTDHAAMRGRLLREPRSPGFVLDNVILPRLRVSDAQAGRSSGRLAPPHLPVHTASAFRSLSRLRMSLKPADSVPSWKLSFAQASV